MAKTVLLDSGFLIRLMNPNEPLHRVALRRDTNLSPVTLSPVTHDQTEAVQYFYVHFF